jgi:hypothetical protein
MRFEVLMTVKVSVLVFWVLRQCGVVGRYGGMWRQYEVSGSHGSEYEDNSLLGYCAM